MTGSVQRRNVVIRAKSQIRALMGMLIEDGMVPGGGPPGRANLGDYVMSESESLAQRD